MPCIAEQVSHDHLITDVHKIYTLYIHHAAHFTATSINALPFDNWRDIIRTGKSFDLASYNAF